MQLGSSAQPAVPTLIEILRDDRRQLATLVQAVSILGSIGSDDDAVAAALTEMLQDKDIDVRIEAVHSLEKTGVKTAAGIQALAGAVRDPSIRWCAVSALSRLGSQAVPDIMAVLVDEEPQVRTAATFALGFMGREAKGAVVALIKALADKDAGTRAGATAALGEIGEDARAAIPTLRQLVKDENADVRRQAIFALADIEPQSRAVVRAIDEAQKDPDPRVRSACDTVRRKLERD